MKSFRSGTKNSSKPGGIIMESRLMESLLELYLP
jgi:hypothetical protein